MDMSFVANILNTGVTGFAFLMLFLGFRLTSKVQEKILEHKPSDFNDIEMYREWKGVIASQVTNTRYFIAFSLLFFAGGLFLLVYQVDSKHKKAGSEIIVATSPEELAFEPRILFQNTPINLSESSSLKVKDGEILRVSYDSPMKKINTLEDKLTTAQQIKKSLIIDKADTSDDSGF